MNKQPMPGATAVKQIVFDGILVLILGAIGIRVSTAGALAIRSLG